MRKNILCLLTLSFLLFVSQNILAQLYVSPNSYMYVADNYVYVNQDVNIQNSILPNDINGKIYLRNESQLLQGTTGVSGNTGDGKLSVFQEGTHNNYAYNYWCSPVGNGSSAFNPFGVSMLHRPTDLTASTPATLISTLDGLATNSSLSIASRWVFKFLSSTNYSQWFQVASASTIQAGEGFTMKGVGGSDNTTVLDGRLLSGLPSGTGVKNNPGSKQRYDFRGKPNDGTIDVTVGSSGSLTLTGNPYPSAINLNLFLLENSGFNVDYITGTYTPGGPVNLLDNTAYFWDQDPSINSHVLTAYAGGYGTYVPNNTNAFSPGTYVEAPWNNYLSDGTQILLPPTFTGSLYERMMTPIGQGFMVKSNSAGGTVKMKNSYRVFRKEGVANNSQFHRSAKPSEFWDETPNVAGVDYTKHSKKELPQIKIHTLINNAFVKQMALAFNPNTTDGYDPGMDAKSADKNLTSDTYFPLDDKNQYVISTLPFDIEKRIPIALKCNSRASFKLTVGSLINFDLADTIFIYDKLTATYHDIKNGYYDVTLDAESKDRFEITFKNPALSTTDSEISKSLTVFQNNDANELVVSNPQLIDMKSCFVYDILGKVIFGKESLGNKNQYAFSTTSLSDGVYIVKMKTSANLEISKKVIVKKK